MLVTQYSSHAGVIARLSRGWQVVHPPGTARRRAATALERPVEICAPKANPDTLSRQERQTRKSLPNRHRICYASVMRTYNGEKSVRELLLKYAPDFCWLTAQELCAMIEQARPYVDPQLVQATIAGLHRNGHLISRPTLNRPRKAGRRPLQYLRVAYHT